MIEYHDEIQIMRIPKCALATAGSTAAIEKELMRAMDEFEPRVVFDMKNLCENDSPTVGMLSSNLISILISVRQAIEYRQGKLAAAAVSGSVLEAFRVTCMDKFLPIYPTVDSAIRSIEGKDQE